MTEDQIQPEAGRLARGAQLCGCRERCHCRLQTLPCPNRLLRKTHDLRCEGVRGENKQPGEFRIGQNWIGGSSLMDAVFIPASGWRARLDE